MEIKEIEIQDSKGNREIGFFSISDQPPWKNAFNSPSIGEVLIEEYDLFEAMVYLRNFLKEKNYIVLCNGARADVFPSAMSRDMSRGRKAYITIFGQQGNPENLIDIFDFTEPHLISTPEAQEEFHEKWFKSLGK
ncbi:MAG: hypothetical protein G3M70_15605 [Candidatus Nitronauta litoralis]|uniref:Uncharacterized protein n=1 Tax=Candidatus Nitronauta litoralis TaxID=2705533 RepID=A0A7T0BYG0_9BACT|nr:MAG: hypothetical protein G3M70_15605 [Candidatus Nitronauta litoralis]